MSQAGVAAGQSESMSMPFSPRFSGMAAAVAGPAPFVAGAVADARPQAANGGGGGSGGGASPTQGMDDDEAYFARSSGDGDAAPPPRLPPASLPPTAGPRDLLPRTAAGLAPPPLLLRQPAVVEAFSGVLAWVAGALATLQEAQWTRVGFEPSWDGSCGGIDPAKPVYSMVNPNAAIERTLAEYRGEAMTHLAALKEAIEPLLVTESAGVAGASEAASFAAAAAASARQVRPAAAEAAAISGGGGGRDESDDDEDRPPSASAPSFTISARQCSLDLPALELACFGGGDCGLTVGGRMSRSTSASLGLPLGEVEDTCFRLATGAPGGELELACANLAQHAAGHCISAPSSPVAKI